MNVMDPGRQKPWSSFAAAIRKAGPGGGTHKAGPLLRVLVLLHAARARSPSRRPTGIEARVKQSRARHHGMVITTSFDGL